MGAKIHKSWGEFFQTETSKPYFQELKTFVDDAYNHTTCYPDKSLIFNAFRTDLNEVKVVILGQDPYHTPGMAHGLAFSVPESQPLPPSLKNIYKEIENDLGYKPEYSGNLTRWQKQGVLLLNTVLTVEAHKAASHQKHGWETFTTATISYLSKTLPACVFILWGSPAGQKEALIDKSKHLVLKSVHPSPLSASRGFFGNHHFSTTNSYLKDHNLPEIDWH